MPAIVLRSSPQSARLLARIIVLNISYLEGGTVQGAGDWNSFFALLPVDLRRELKQLFGLPTAGDIDKAVGALPDGAPPDLVDLRVVATALANPDSELVENEFDAAGKDPPDLPGREAKAVWLFLQQRQVYDEMVQLLEHERHFQKDSSWNGYEIDAAFNTKNIAATNDQLKADLARALGTRTISPGEVHLSVFTHASSRLGEAALHLTIAFGRGRETVATFDAGRRSRQSFRRERVVSVVFDTEAGRRLRPRASSGSGRSGASSRGSRQGLEGRAPVTCLARQAGEG